MKVVIVSKALVSATYRRKLTEMAALGVDITAVIPNQWREGGGQRYEPSDDRSYQVVVTPIRFNGRFHLHYYPALPGILSREQPDIVHVDEEPYNLATFLGISSASRAGIPGIFFTWQNILRKLPPPFRQMESYVYARSALGLAGTDEARQVLQTKGYRGRIAVVPQFGVDPAVFRPGEPPAGPFTIGFFNRLTPGKAPLLVLSALEALPRDTQLLMVGDGPLRAEVEREIEARGLQRRVTLLPRVPSDRMPDLVRRIHVSVLPSVTTPTWKEQFGRVLIEAMASGIPVVGSDSGEIPRVVGNAGLIVPEGDPAALARAVETLYTDTELRRALGARGRQRVLDCFTHAKIAERTVAAYVQALGA
jgi:glycosyltransferase involved in cell wall biosynthesis